MLTVRHIRDLSSSEFHHLCFRVLSARYPNAGVKSVEGSGGDRGLDVFSGVLSEEPLIWQCKRFDYVRAAQKKQIRDSLGTALKNYKPRNWVLCVSIDLNARGHEWFQELQREFADRVNVELVQASDILNEIVLRRTIIDEFFPNVQLDTGLIKALAANTSGLTTQRLGDVTAEHVDQIKRRLERRDGRLAYTISYPAVPPISPEQIARESAERILPDGIVMSAYDGTKVIDMYARDKLALAQDPPTLSIIMDGKAAAKLSEAIRLGSSQELESVTISDLPAPIAELFPATPASGWKVIISPDRPLKKLFARATFTSKAGAAVYEQIEFAIVRPGTEEIEIRSVQQDLPFVLSVVGSIFGKAKLSLKQTIVNKEVHAVQKWSGILRMFEEGEVELELFDLGRRAKLARASVFARTLHIPAEALSTVNGLVELSDKCGQPVHFPEKWLREYDAALRFALDAVRTGQARKDDIDTVAFKRVRDPQVGPDMFPHEQPAPFCVRCAGTYTFEIGRDKIDLGPYTLTCTAAMLLDYAATRKAFFGSKEGEAVQFVFKPQDSVNYVFPKFLQARPGAQPPG